MAGSESSGVDELISQMKEICVLEQVSKINTCSFNDYDLPSHFLKLKSQSHNHPLASLIDHSINSPDQFEFELETLELSDQMETKSKNPQFLVSPSSSSSSSKRTSIKASKKLNSPLNPPSVSASSSSGDSSPSPRKSGCLWFSPIKKKKKIDESTELFMDSLISVKEQQKILKKALKDEEKINREAEKIVKWAKQASNRLSGFHGLEHDDFIDVDDDDDDDDDDESK